MILRILCRLGLIGIERLGRFDGKERLRCRGCGQVRNAGQPKNCGEGF